ncbi:MAG: rhodanese-like domain-containing protein [Rhodospirillales bacterium]|nr:rhodanese-like domain-containing protein [Rhodospirillales bacterium]
MDDANVENNAFAGDIGYAGDIGPRQAWEILVNSPKATMIDVRTAAEWAYVGVPDLSGIGKKVEFVSWLHFPGMQINARFVEEVTALGIDPLAPVLFVCRSGVRSKFAAIAMTRRGFRACYNVAHGFEGDLDTIGHRGAVSGWKVEGLPWKQG